MNFKSLINDICCDGRIKDGIFEPNNTCPTISNAMDVSNPSNFVRIQKIYNNDLQKIRN